MTLAVAVCLAIEESSCSLVPLNGILVVFHVVIYAPLRMTLLIEFLAENRVLSVRTLPLCSYQACK